MEQDRRPRNKPTFLRSTKKARIYNGENTDSSKSGEGKSGAGKTGQLQKVVLGKLDSYL